MTEMTYFARQCYSVTRGSIPQSVVNSAVDEWKARLRAYVKCKGKGPDTCYSATYVRLVTSSALQSWKWQLIGMSQWCHSALCEDEGGIILNICCKHLVLFRAT